MADILYSAFGQIAQRYVDMGLGADGKPSFAPVYVPQGGVASGATDSGNPLKVGGVVNTSAPNALTTGQRADLWMNARGAVIIGAQSSTSADSIGANIGWVSDLAGTARPLGVAPYIFNGTGFDRQTKASATSRVPSSAATTNATVAKASAGTVYAIETMNTTATVKYLKLYNKATAPTVGTDTPVRTIALPPSNARAIIQFPTGLYFATGISYAMTGAAADADTTALALGDVVGTNIDYS